MFLTSRLPVFSVRSLTSRPALRTMSLLSSGHVLSGAHWRYRIIEPLKGDESHKSTIFKAEILADNNVSDAPKWAIIKAASPDDELNVEALGREKKTYRLPGVSSAPCYRKIYDEIDDNTVALEWLDGTLQDLKYQPQSLIYAIIKASMRASLASAAVIERQEYVNTDFKPANILISGLTGDDLVVKVGDLGMVYPSNTAFQAQPWSMRAPEVFLNEPCYGPSQVWAIAAMVLVWIKREILGASDCPHWILSRPWSMGKLRRLFPQWQLPDPDQVKGHEFKAAIEISGRMSCEEMPMLEISPLQEEMLKIEMPQQLRELLSFMFVTDPEARPSAADVLASDEFQAFEKSVEE